MINYKGWICDSCGGHIEKIGDGWVEWITFTGPAGEEVGRNMRLVHIRPASPRKDSLHGCQFDDNKEFKLDKGMINDMPLESFIGPNGLMYLLSMLARNVPPKEQVIEMIKRLHVPDYEFARFHFKRAEAEGVVEPSYPGGFYSQREIGEVLKHYGEGTE